MRLEGEHPPAARESTRCGHRVEAEVRADIHKVAALSEKTADEAELGPIEEAQKVVVCERLLQIELQGQPAWKPRPLEAGGRRRHVRVEAALAPEVDEPDDVVREAGELHSRNRRRGPR